MSPCFTLFETGSLLLVTAVYASQPAHKLEMFYLCLPCPCRHSLGIADVTTAFRDYKGAGERRCSGLFRECFTLNSAQPHLVHCFCLRFNPRLVWRLTRCLPLAVNRVCHHHLWMVIISSQSTLPIVSKIPCKCAQQEERGGLAPKEQDLGLCFSSVQQETSLLG